MRKTNEQSLKDVIQDLLNAYKLKGKLNEFRLVKSWEKVMGTTIASRTSDIFIRNQTLFIRIASAPLKNQLFLSKTEVMKMLNDEAGEIIITNMVLL
ncbi:MAG: DUF721 domain-containing protein [Bacteroidota bacterium]